MLQEVRKWLVQALELLLWVVAILTLLQVLFGEGIPLFFHIDVIGNIGDIMTKFGNAGLVGVIAAAIVAYLILRSRVAAESGPPQQKSSGPPMGGLPGTHG